MALLPIAQVDAVRAYIADVVRGPLERPDDAYIHRVYGQPAGDPGLVSWCSPAQQVHADLPAMLCGGFAALLLQTLHPGAMAGVAEHSNYRGDPYGRLRRTASFIAVTTYGSTMEAMRSVARVRAIHKRVRGMRPDGLPYSADDPTLLRWVHTTEAWSFLRAMQEFGPEQLPVDSCDRYFADTAPIAERLGATDIPRSAAEAEAFLEGIRAELRYDAQAREAVHFLLEGPRRSRAETAGVRFLFQCAITLLPAWARELLELPALDAARLRALRATSRVTFPVVRWALGPHPPAQASRLRQLSSPAAQVR